MLLLWSGIALAQNAGGLKFDELDEAVSKPKKPAVAADADMEEGEGPLVEAVVEPKAASPLPSLDVLVNAKLEALLAKQSEQEAALKIAEQKLMLEKDNQNRIFDSSAYFSLAIINTAPVDQYRLDSTAIYLDGSSRPFARGGKRNHGLPHSYEVFFGAVTPGCHEVRVVAKYVRLKNNLIEHFLGVKREVIIDESQTFIAKDGYRVEIEIEGFEKQNQVARFFRGPAVRFNTFTRVNYLQGASLVNLDDVLKQGRVHIDYLTDPDGSHRLIEKSISIDGLPVLTNEKQNPENLNYVIFDAPLAEGNHRLNVTLLFGQKKWVGGGPLYNFRLSFDRDFSVISGQTTIVNLVGMPRDGVRSNPLETRYARATSQIVETKDPSFFPNESCRVHAERELELLREKEINKVVPEPEQPKAHEAKPEHPAAPEVAPEKAPEGEHLVPIVPEGGGAIKEPESAVDPARLPKEILPSPPAG